MLFGDKETYVSGTVVGMKHKPSAADAGTLADASALVNLSKGVACDALAAYVDDLVKLVAAKKDLGPNNGGLSCAEIGKRADQAARSTASRMLAVITKVNPAAAKNASVALLMANLTASMSALIKSTVTPLCNKQTNLVKASQLIQRLKLIQAAYCVAPPTNLLLNIDTAVGVITKMSLGGGKGKEMDYTVAYTFQGKPRTYVYRIALPPAWVKVNAKLTLYIDNKTGDVRKVAAYTPPIVMTPTPTPGAKQAIVVLPPGAVVGTITKMSLGSGKSVNYTVSYAFGKTMRTHVYTYTGPAGSGFQVNTKLTLYLDPKTGNVNTVKAYPPPGSVTVTTTPGPTAAPLLTGVAGTVVKSTGGIVTVQYKIGTSTFQYAHPAAKRGVFNSVVPATAGLPVTVFVSANGTVSSVGSFPLPEGSGGVAGGYQAVLATVAGDVKGTAAQGGKIWVVALRYNGKARTVQVANTAVNSWLTKGARVVVFVTPLATIGNPAKYPLPAGFVAPQVLPLTTTMPPGTTRPPLTTTMPPGTTRPPLATTMPPGTTMPPAVLDQCKMYAFGTADHAQCCDIVRSAGEYPDSQAIGSCPSLAVVSTPGPELGGGSSSDAGLWGNQISNTSDAGLGGDQMGGGEAGFGGGDAGLGGNQMGDAAGFGGDQMGGFGGDQMGGGEAGGFGGDQMGGDQLGQMGGDQMGGFGGDQMGGFGGDQMGGGQMGGGQLGQMGGGQLGQFGNMTGGGVGAGGLYGQDAGLGGSRYEGRVPVLDQDNMPMVDGNGNPVLVPLDPEDLDQGDFNANFDTITVQDPEDGGEVVVAISKKPQKTRKIDIITTDDKRREQLKREQLKREQLKREQLERQQRATRRPAPATMAPAVDDDDDNDDDDGIKTTAAPQTTPPQTAPPQKSGGMFSGIKWWMWGLLVMVLGAIGYFVFKGKGGSNKGNNGVNTGPAANALVAKMNTAATNANAAVNNLVNNANNANYSSTMVDDVVNANINALNTVQNAVNATNKAAAKLVTRVR